MLVAVWWFPKASYSAAANVVKTDFQVQRHGSVPFQRRFPYTLDILNIRHNEKHGFKLNRRGANMLICFSVVFNHGVVSKRTPATSGATASQQEQTMPATSSTFHITEIASISLQRIRQLSLLLVRSYPEV